MRELRNLKDHKEEGKSKTTNEDLNADFFSNKMDLNYAIKKHIKEHEICCCQRGTLHNESMKFVLKADQEHKNMKLFENRAKGELIELYKKNLLDNISYIYDERFLIGRNKDIQRIVQNLCGLYN